MSRRRFCRRRRRRQGPTTARYAARPDHRRPTLTLFDRVAGLCRVCNGAVDDGVRGRKRTWHDGRNNEPTCVQDWLHRWKMQTRPNYAKRFVAERDGAKCKRCADAHGKSFTWLHLDHVVALADGGSPDADNFQLLCPPCHIDKTSGENTARAAAKRQAVAA